MDYSGAGELTMPWLFSSVGRFSSVGKMTGQSLGSTYTNATNWPSGNRAFFIPFYLPAPYNVRKVWWHNGSVVSGNLDVGIYAPDGTRLYRLYDGVTSIAQTGTNTVQGSVQGMPWWLDEGDYYMAFQLDNGTGRIGCNSTGTISVFKAAGLLSQNVGSYGLPATATFVTLANAFLPWFAFSDSPNRTP